MNKGDIIKALPKLSAVDMAEVATAINVLSAMGLAPRAAEPRVGDDWVLSSIAAYLAQRGLVPAINAIFDLRRRDAFRQYQTKLPGVMEFLEALRTRNGVTKRQTPALGFLCATALGSMLTKRNYFSVSAMLSQVDKIPEALDEAYPGYAYARMFGFLLRPVEER